MLQQAHSNIEDDPDFVQWTFPTNHSMADSHSNTGSNHHDNHTIRLPGLENSAMSEKKEPVMPTFKDLRGIRIFKNIYSLMYI